MSSSLYATLTRRHFRINCSHLIAFIHLYIVFVFLSFNRLIKQKDRTLRLKSIENRLDDNISVQYSLIMVSLCILLNAHRTHDPTRTNGNVQRISLYYSGTSNLYRGGGCGQNSGILAGKWGRQGPIVLFLLQFIITQNTTLCSVFFFKML